MSLNVLSEPPSSAETAWRILPQGDRCLIVSFGDRIDASIGRTCLAAAARLREARLPDAVFAANDMMALGCLYAFNQAGVRVPEQVALAGFDDIPLARFVHPSLTTMQVSIADLGGRATSHLLHLIDRDDASGGVGGAILVPRLIVRDSTSRRKTS